MENYCSKCNEKIIRITDDYSIGPISDIDTKKGLQKRIEWIETLLKKVSNECFIEIKEDLLRTYDHLNDIEEASQIIILHGENTNDQVGLRYLMAFLKSKEIYEVNVSELYLEYPDGIKYKPLSLGCYRPELIAMLFTRVKKIEPDRITKLLSEWQVLRSSKEKLRILENDKVVGVEETYYDKDVLSNCTCQFQKAAKVIGRTMGTIMERLNQLVGDTYIEYRVRQMINSEKIEYRGNLLTMRDYEIRLKG